MYQMIGSITLFTGEKTPENWLDCDGKVLIPLDNQELFSLLGTRHGGDGAKTFNLPKMPKVGDARYIICVKGKFPRRA